MPETVASIPEPALDLKNWLVEGGANVGEVRVVDAAVGWDEDADGNVIVRFSVSLSDPKDETWPVADILEFHRRIEDRAAELGLSVPSYVGLSAETPEELDLS